MEVEALKILDQNGGDSRKAAEAIYQGPDKIKLDVIKAGLKQLAKLQRRSR